MKAYGLMWMFAIEQATISLSIVLVLLQARIFVNRRVGIANCFCVWFGCRVSRSFRSRLLANGFAIATALAPGHDDSDIADQRAKHALAVAGGSCWRTQSRGRSLPNCLSIWRFFFVCHFVMLRASDAQISQTRPLQFRQPLRHDRSSVARACWQSVD